jgi:hypothetical protein
MHIGGLILTLFVSDLSGRASVKPSSHTTQSNVVRWRVMASRNPSKVNLGNMTSCTVTPRDITMFESRTTLEKEETYWHAIVTVEM